MLRDFEATARKTPDYPFFYFEDEIYSYEKTRILASALARALQLKGVRPGNLVALDMPNCPSFVLMILAAAYGGFALVALNHKQSDYQKQMRIDELSSCPLKLAATLTEDMVQELIAQMFDTHTLDKALAAKGEFAEFLAQQEEQAVRLAQSYDAHMLALVMFSSGTTGKPKAVPLTWHELTSSAHASNERLSAYGNDLWQLVLPLYHVGGFQIVTRSILSVSSFVLYRKFNAQRVVADACALDATHISLVNSMLEDMLKEALFLPMEVSGSRPAHAREESIEDMQSVLAQYECILLGGAKPKFELLCMAAAYEAPVFVSYGMTETASHVAVSEFTSSFDGGLQLLPGYQACIVNAEGAGIGTLALRGPSVAGSYLNAQANLLNDDFFVTGDKAYLEGGKLYIQERSDDMFVSGGENVYPQEIVSVLTAVPGVADACVIALDDERWGQRPLAFVERVYKEDLLQDDPLYAADVSFARFVRTEAALKLSQESLPEYVIVLDTIPRTDLGKVNKEALESLVEEYIFITNADLISVEQSFTTPKVSAQKTYKERSSSFVRLSSSQGLVSWGEDVALEEALFGMSSRAQSRACLEDEMLPSLDHCAFKHPLEVLRSLIALEDVTGNPSALAAIDCAIWDLYAQHRKKTLSEALLESAQDILASHNIDQAKWAADCARQQARLEEMCSWRAYCVASDDISAAKAEILKALKAGYARIKLKISPKLNYGAWTRLVSEMQASYPEIVWSFDANQSFDLHIEEHLEAYKAWDSLGALYIEEPLVRASGASVQEHFEALSQLQCESKTQICLDESCESSEEVLLAFGYEDLSCVNIKPGKLGGLSVALELCMIAWASERDVVLGGLWDTTISKMANKALAAFPCVYVPIDATAAQDLFGQELASVRLSGLGLGVDVSRDF